MPEDRYSDISGLSPEDQELVRLARADYARIDALPPDTRGGISREKQADPVGMRPDGTLNITESTEDDGDA